MGSRDLRSIARVIKSIQQGSTTINSPDTQQTTTIAAVNVARAFILLRMAADGSGGTSAVWAELTNSTTVTAFRSSGTGSQVVYWTVVEFY